MVILFRQEWTESEAGWGQRRDGYSYHLDAESAKSFIKDYWDKMPKTTPSEYSRPDGEPESITTTLDHYIKVSETKNGLRTWEDFELKNKTWEVSIDIIQGDKKINEFMHAADVFEKGKQLGEHQNMNFEITGKDEPNWQEIVDKIFESSSKEFNILFVSIREIDGKTPKESFVRFKEGVQSISNGKQWGLFSDCLNQLGYQCEVNDIMHVTSIFLPHVESN